MDRSALIAALAAGLLAPERDVVALDLAAAARSGDPGETQGGPIQRRDADDRPMASAA